MTSRHTVRAAAAALVFSLGAACSKDSTSPAADVDPATGTITNMKGTLANTTYSGDIDINIAATATSGSAAITGCVYLKSATCTAAAGTYTVSSKALAFTTTSPALSFAGTYASGVVQGTVSGAGGAGFMTIRKGSVSVYCGSFSGAAAGRWNFVITGSTLDGIYNDGSGNVRLTGSVNSSNAASITFASGTAAGTISGASASGTWTAGTSTGTWTGSNSGCRA